MNCAEILLSEKHFCVVQQQRGKSMNKTISSVFAGAIMTSMISTAQADLTANIGLASDYMWRGVSQSDRDVALSGGLDYSHGSGLFIGTWASNTEFSGEGGYELDVYFGYAGEAADLGYTITVNYYAYPDYDESSFTELLVDLNYGMFSTGVAYTVHSDVTDPAPFNTDDVYVYIGVGHSFDDNWSVSGTVGHYDYSADGFGGAANYTHGQIDLTRSLGRFGDLTLTVSKTDEEAVDDNVLALLAWTKTFELN